MRPRPQTRDDRAAWAFVAPALVHLVLFALAPIVVAFGVSLFDWKVLKGTMPFVGLGTYAGVLSDEGFWNAMGNSLEFAFLSVPTGMAVALAVAVLVTQQLRGLGFFRTVYYVPAVSSGVAVSMLWIYVYLPESGLINATTRLFGIASVDFLNDPAWAMPALAFMAVWTGLGPKMVVYAAGLLAIPPAVHEAAALDGAVGWRRFWAVTWPLLGPTHLFVLVTATIGALQVFTPVYTMTRGGPMGATDVVGYHIYTEAWVRFHVSTAAAQSFLLLLVTGAAAWLQFRLLRDQAAGWGAA